MNSGRYFEDLGMPFLKFCLVGASGVVVDMGVLWFLLQQDVMTVPMAVAKALAAESAIVNNFVWNDRWTFRNAAGASDRGSGLARFLRFNAISFAGLGLNVGLFLAQVSLLGTNPYLANAVAIVLVACFNFGMSRRYGWRVRRAQATG
jgi:dolichol-phosphate mannosyltransferase